MTLSIAGRCAETGMRGGAVTSSSICVASRCLFTRAGVGTALTQNVTDPSLGEKMLNLLESGGDVKTAVSKVVSDENWQFIHSNDDNFSKIDKFLKKNLDCLYIDSYHEPLHVEKVFNHYFDYLKIGGICIIDDVSWLPYCKNEYRDNEFSENINKLIFYKILEIYNQNKNNLSLEFYFEGSGLAILRKKNDGLNKSKKIISREFSVKNLIKKFIKVNPKK